MLLHVYISYSIQKMLPSEAQYCLGAKYSDVFSLGSRLVSFKGKGRHTGLAIVPCVSVESTFWFWGLEVQIPVLGSGVGWH